MIRRWTKVTDVLIVSLSLGDSLFHFITIIAMKTVPLNNAGYDVFSKNICSNAIFTDDVPAPDEPVTAMIGCFCDTRILPRGDHQCNVSHGTRIKGGGIISV